MKRMNSAYRLQVIKEVAIRKQLTSNNDPMANHISHLLETRAHREGIVEQHQTYSDNHFDEQVGGWVSNQWDAK
ncbi:hypothetical protein [Photobacterium sanguinicancri]|uniref:Uncharacterized protein n=1 Tax=Photobacterium sanguinicancri TaxID=875932 RepID=A0AAW7Y316_9GAMM|nr:hypothetical protein [Photobacterium sanguinicancri]KXI22367.1 hypothetical protein AS132_14820 [Photobacterium sanguinicancri]MDO6498542.1 hypothetical protein [Photobacterium sanguinicancri]MDO6542993.1 hypothetical protein [Photobacterium sanguinicancri]OZS42332.1 hypothetical protein ASV53_18960 [Photobacterium sanguinicancri]